MTLPYYKMQNISRLHNTSIEKGVISELLIVISGYLSRHFSIDRNLKGNKTVKKIQKYYIFLFFLIK